MVNPSNITGLLGAGSKRYTYRIMYIYPRALTTATCFVNNCYPTQVHRQILNGYTYIELLGTVEHSPLGTAVAVQTILPPAYGPKRAAR